MRWCTSNALLGVVVFLAVSQSTLAQSSTTTTTFDGSGAGAGTTIGPTTAAATLPQTRVAILAQRAALSLGPTFVANEFKRSLVEYNSIQIANSTQFFAVRTFVPEFRHQVYEINTTSTDEELLAMQDAVSSGQVIVVAPSASGGRRFVAVSYEDYIAEKSHTFGYYAIAALVLAVLAICCLLGRLCMCSCFDLERNEVVFRADSTHTNTLHYAPLGRRFNGPADEDAEAGVGTARKKAMMADAATFAAADQMVWDAGTYYATGTATGMGQRVDSINSSLFGGPRSEAGTMTEENVVYGRQLLGSQPGTVQRGFQFASTRRGNGQYIDVDDDQQMQQEAQSLVQVRRSSLPQQHLSLRRTSMPQEQQINMRRDSYFHRNSLGMPSPLLMTQQASPVYPVHSGQSTMHSASSTLRSGGAVGGVVGGQSANTIYGMHPVVSTGPDLIVPRRRKSTFGMVDSRDLVATSAGDPASFSQRNMHPRPSVASEHLYASIPAEQVNARVGPRASSQSITSHAESTV
eukprot:m.360450 g.360450  ORF g.360450 m.360450 type:complete len:519 (-) comp19056_c0_seq1:468-2024(-)